MDIILNAFKMSRYVSQSYHIPNLSHTIFHILVTSGIESCARRVDLWLNESYKTTTAVPVAQPSTKLIVFSHLRILSDDKQELTGDHTRVTTRLAILYGELVVLTDGAGDGDGDYDYDYDAVSCELFTVLVVNQPSIPALSRPLMIVPINQSIILSSLITIFTIFLPHHHYHHHHPPPPHQLKPPSSHLHANNPTQPQASISQQVNT
ncbi:hypothetical protein EYC84_003710 [Monilinia fructicola]|uniref:Uncharacterized protein n=1 Tax=Monilinia fructicola TaxID=38448 RepID=A0A5M9JUL4_MONFR|nr:hypothetical protein EYC84_003710 [Monilinia fructicola]